MARVFFVSKWIFCNDEKLCSWSDGDGERAPRGTQRVVESCTVDADERTKWHFRMSGKIEASNTISASISYGDTKRR